MDTDDIEIVDDTPDPPELVTNTWSRRRLPMVDDPVPDAAMLDTTTEAPQYEVLETDGRTETYDTSGPNMNVPMLDEATKARAHAAAHLFAARVLKKERRKLMLTERQRGRTAKSRRKRALERASRKKNR